MKDTLQKNEGSGSEQSEIEQNELVTDTDLENAGLIKVTAFIRSAQSETAKRKAKQREKDQAEGLKQLNLKASTEDHELLKTIANELKTASEEQKKLLSEIIGNLKKTPVMPAPVTSPKKVTGFKGLIVKLLLKLLELLK